MGAPAQTRTASGNIPISVFVTSVGQTEFYAAVAGVGSQPIGISQEWPKDPPGISGSNTYAAEDGDQFRLYGVANERALLIPGATWLAGQLLKPMAGGLGTPVVTNNALQYFGARALEAAVQSQVTNGNPVQVETWFGQVNPGTSTTTTSTTTTTTTT